MVHIQIGGERESKGSPRLCQQENLWCHSEGRRPEESGVKAFQKQNQVFRSAQDDRVVSF